MSEGSTGPTPETRDPDTIYRDMIAEGWTFIGIVRDGHGGFAGHFASPQLLATKREYGGLS